ncbi:MAG: STAS/SEC14 domain-containing protein, partial [Cyanobacteria bacterium J06554_11]
MATVQIKSDVDIDQLLEGVAQLDTTELQQFLTRASLLLAQRQDAALPSSESDLLRQINQGLPADTQHRYDEL